MLKASLINNYLIHESKLGNQNEAVSKVVSMLTKRNSIYVINDMIRDLDRSLSQLSNSNVTTVSTGRSISSELAQEIANGLDFRAEKIVINSDPNLLGGIKITSSEKSIDLSVCNRVIQLRKH